MPTLKFDSNNYEENYVQYMFTHLCIMEELFCGDMEGWTNINRSQIPHFGLSIFLVDMYFNKNVPLIVYNALDYVEPPQNYRWLHSKIQIGLRDWIDLATTASFQLATAEPIVKTYPIDSIVFGERWPLDCSEIESTFGCAEWNRDERDVNHFVLRPEVIEAYYTCDALDDINDELHFNLGAFWGDTWDRGNWNR